MNLTNNNANHIDYLKVEAKSLLVRINQIKPFSLTIPSVPAAAVSDDAMSGITDLMSSGLNALKLYVTGFINDLANPLCVCKKPEEIQEKYVMLKLHFNSILDQIDIYGDALGQRAEHETGILLGGLDVVANDALNLNEIFYKRPPIICYLERGHGAAIRRVKTRLPGGQRTPTAIISCPRDRIFSSITCVSSVCHEAGHQGAALLGLVDSLKSVLIQKEQSDAVNTNLWTLYRSWIGEIVSDFWALGLGGIGATLGLISVVSLPKYVMFKSRKLTAVHPFPWIRVSISIAFGKKLFPDKQWAKIEQIWNTIYPLESISIKERYFINRLVLLLPSFINTVIHHKCPALKGKELHEVFPLKQRQPYKLRDYFSEWKKNPDFILRLPPTLALAILGQAKSDGLLDPINEGKELVRLLKQWAFIYAENRNKKESIELTSVLKTHVYN